MDRQQQQQWRTWEEIRAEAAASGRIDEAAVAEHRERMRAESDTCWCGCDYPCCANGCVGAFRWRLWQLGNHARRLAGRPYWKRGETELEGCDDGTGTA